MSPGSPLSRFALAIASDSVPRTLTPTVVLLFCPLGRSLLLIRYLSMQSMPSEKFSELASSLVRLSTPHLPLRRDTLFPFELMPPRALNRPKQERAVDDANLVAEAKSQTEVTGAAATGILPSLPAPCRVNQSQPCLLSSLIRSSAHVRALAYARRYVADQQLMRKLSGAAPGAGNSRSAAGSAHDGQGSIFGMLTQTVNFPP